MKAKLVTVLVAVALIFIGVVIWRTDRLVFGDRLSWVQAQTRTQLGALSRSVVTELESQQKILLSISPENFQKGQLPWNALAPYYAAATFTIQGQQLLPQVFVTKENSKASQWTLDFVQKAIGPLAARSNGQRYYVKSFQDAQKGRYVAILFLNGNRASAVFGSGENFQALIDSQKGSSSEFSIINLSGLTIGHPTPDYVGTILSENPLLKEARTSGSAFGTVTFNSKNGDVLGMFELIPHTNMALLSSASVKDLQQGRSSIWFQFFLMGLGLVLFAVAAIIVIVAPADKKYEEMKEQVEAFRNKSLQATNPIASDKVIAQDPELVHKEKLEASIKVASALAHEMSGPLTSITGYSQLILASDPRPEVVDPVDSILRETRGAKAILNKLLGFAGESAQEKSLLRVEAPLAKVLKDMDPLFGQKGVQVQRILESTLPISLNPEALSMALTHILQNAVEAMERMSKKSLQIKTYDSDLGVHLEISDSGEGIEATNIEKVFDPFFTTRPFQNHMGLGLSLAFGILKDHKADVKIESQRGKGTQVSIVFKKDAGIEKVPSLLRSREPMVVAADLPQLKVDSPDRIEAEAIYEEVKESQSGQPSSPLDINIDSLLDLSESNLDSREEFSVSEQTVAIANSPSAEELEEISTQALDATPPSVMSSEFAEPNKKVEYVNPPQFIERPTNESKLGSYKVEIRRPGKRL